VVRSHSVFWKYIADGRIAIAHRGPRLRDARPARKPAEKPHREFAGRVPMGSPGWRDVGRRGRFQIFLGEKSQMVRSRFHSAGPRDVRDGLAIAHRRSQRRYARDGRRSRVGGGWPGRSMARPMRPRWRARVRHRCRAATGLTLRDGLTFVETTIRLLLVKDSIAPGWGGSGRASLARRPSGHC
jgi:hypothetical protein